MATNSLKLVGTIRRAPVLESAPHKRVRATLQINEESKFPQMAPILAVGPAADKLLQLTNGDRVVIRGQLSVSMRTDKLQIFVDSIQPYEDSHRPFPCVHHMQFPQMGAAR